MIVRDIAEVSFRVPGWVADLDSFRRWAHSDDFPNEVPLCWLNDEVWIDVSKEQIFTHLLVKGVFHGVLWALVQAEKLGLVMPDGLLLSSFVADFAGKPDLTFISTATWHSDRVRLIEGDAGGFVEIQGSPDMVLEIVSHGSVTKDTIVLKDRYWEAGIQEYWLVDVRKDPIRFDIFKHAPNGYASARKQKGWVRSEVFGKSFSLTKTEPLPDQPRFHLAVK